MLSARAGMNGLFRSVPLNGVLSMRIRLVTAFLVLLLPLAGRAQERATPPQRPPRVPANLMPPAGKCRVWIEGIAPAQQPAPTDCQAALRTRPLNGTVIYGPQRGKRDSEAFETPPARETVPARREPSAAPEPRKAPPPRDTTRPPARTRRPAADRPERP